MAFCDIKCSRNGHICSHEEALCTNKRKIEINCFIYFILVEMVRNERHGAESFGGIK